MFFGLLNTSPDSDGETEAVAVGGGVEQAEELVKKLKDELAAKRRITSANKGHTQDVSGKNHRRGIAPKWKRMAKKPRDERMTFSQIQERCTYDPDTRRVYLRSRYKKGVPTIQRHNLSSELLSTEEVGSERVPTGPTGGARPQREAGRRCHF